MANNPRGMYAHSTSHIRLTAWPTCPGGVSSISCIISSDLNMRCLVPQGMHMFQAGSAGCGRALAWSAESSACSFLEPNQPLVRSLASWASSSRSLPRLLLPLGLDVNLLATHSSGGGRRSRAASAFPPMPC